LSISSVSVSTNPRQAGPSDDGWQQFAQLVRAVNAGDLPAAQKAYGNFTQSPAGELAQSNSQGRLAQALSKIGTALQSGDVGRAQEALATIRPRHNPPGAPPTVQAPGIAPAGPNAPGSKLDLSV
jgi:hypothetical protein